MSRFSFFVGCMIQRGWVIGAEYWGRGVRSCSVDHEWTFHAGNWTRTGRSEQVLEWMGIGVIG